MYVYLADFKMLKPLCKKTGCKVRIAEKKGFAIAICHPKSQTYLALKDWLETLKDKNIKLATYASRCIENEILMHFRNNKKRSKDISINESVGFDKEGNEITIIDILKSPKPDLMLLDNPLIIFHNLLYRYFLRCFLLFL